MEWLSIAHWYFVGAIMGFFDIFNDNKKKLLPKSEHAEMVKFSCGRYGVRLKSGRYVDLNNDTYKWNVGDKFFPECKGSHWKVLKLFNRVNDRYTL